MASVNLPDELVGLGFFILFPYFVPAGAGEVVARFLGARMDWVAPVGFFLPVYLYFLLERFVSERQNWNKPWASSTRGLCHALALIAASHFLARRYAHYRMGVAAADCVMAIAIWLFFPRGTMDRLF